MELGAWWRKTVWYQLIGFPPRNPDVGPPCLCPLDPYHSHTAPGILEQYGWGSQRPKGGLWNFPSNNTWVVVSNMFYFHPYLGKWSSLTNIFQMGWNHQLDTCYPSQNDSIRGIFFDWSPIVGGLFKNLLKGHVFTILKHVTIRIAMQIYNGSEPTQNNVVNVHDVNVPKHHVWVSMLSFGGVLYST